MSIQLYHVLIDVTISIGYVSSYSWNHPIKLLIAQCPISSIDSLLFANLSFDYIPNQVNLLKPEPSFRLNFLMNNFSRLTESYVRPDLFAKFLQKLSFLTFVFDEIDYVTNHWDLLCWNEWFLELVCMIDTARA